MFPMLFISFCRLRLPLIPFSFFLKGFPLTFLAVPLIVFWWRFFLSLDSWKIFIFVLLLEEHFLCEILGYFFQYFKNVVPLSFDFYYFWKMYAIALSSYASVYNVFPTHCWILWRYFSYHWCSLFHVSWA